MYVEYLDVQSVLYWIATQATDYYEDLDLIENRVKDEKFAVLDLAHILPQEILNKMLFDLVL